MTTRFAALLVLLWAASSAAGGEREPVRLSGPFFVMDTALRVQGAEAREQLDLVQSLGYAGVSWTLHQPRQLEADLRAIEKRGLKLFAVYCPAKITPAGEIQLPPTLPQVMQILQGHGTLVWLHIGGEGPEFAALDEDHLAVRRLREVADAAQQHSLRVSIYPHFGEWTARFGDATRVAQLVDRPNFGVSFNLCHSLATGEGPRIRELLDESQELLFTATISGADQGVTGKNWNRLIQVLGQGSYDVPAVLHQLQRIGFQGPIGLQGYAIAASPEEVITPAMRIWRRWTTE